MGTWAEVPQSTPPPPGVVQSHFHFLDREVHLNMYFQVFCRLCPFKCGNSR